MFVTRAKYNRERVRAFELGRADGVRAAVAGIEALIASGILDKQESEFAEDLVRHLGAGAELFEARAPAGNTIVISRPLPSVL